MFIRLDSGLVINTSHIIAIEPMNRKVDFVTDKDEKISMQYIIHTIDKHEWYASQKDYVEIGKVVD